MLFQALFQVDQSASTVPAPCFFLLSYQLNHCCIVLSCMHAWPQAARAGRGAAGGQLDRGDPPRPARRRHAGWCGWHLSRGAWQQGRGPQGRAARRQRQWGWPGGRRRRGWGGCSGKGRCSRAVGHIRGWGQGPWPEGPGRYTAAPSSPGPGTIGQLPQPAAGARWCRWGCTGVPRPWRYATTPAAQPPGWRCRSSWCRSRHRGWCWGG